MEHQSEMRRIQIYDEGLKRKVIEEYLAGGCSKMDLLRKYNIRTKSGIQRWMKKFGYSDVQKPTAVKFTPLIFPDLTKKNDLKNDSDLHKKIRELERQLEEEKLRSEAYARIIDKAEKELKIPIRKKPNTK